MSSLTHDFSQYILNHKEDRVLLGEAGREFSDELNPIPRAAPATAGPDHVIPNLPPILDQRDLGSCSAHAGVGALEVLLNQEGHLKRLSRLHLYNICLAYDGSSGVDAGTYLSTVVHQLHKIGTCEERFWPYVDIHVNFKKGPPLEATIRASENRVNGYYKITSKGAQRLVDISTAIRANHPVIFGTKVGAVFMHTDGLTPITADPNDQKGGHATSLVGVQTVGGRLAFLDKNSWGTAWGHHGYAWLDQDYITWDRTSDIWVMTRMDPIA